MSPRPDMSEERTKQILDAATKVFSQKGLDEARMDDIVEASGLSKGTLYLYFKSKDDLIMAILDRLFQREFEKLRGSLSQEGSATERLLSFTEKIVTDLKLWLNLIPVAYEFLGLVFRNKTVQKTFKTYLSGYLELLTPIIQQGIDNGEFKHGNAHDIAIATGAIFEGTLLLWVYDKQLIDPEKHIRTGINYFLEGIKA
ncbi:MAG: TetR/AcrR family transcriptional regulator [Anaerolineales bacterium]|nr:TetR/AcrR family transcriptional regulator [Anaerolineales bacterium]